MKKVFKVFLNFFFILLVVLVCLIFILYAFFTYLEKRQEKSQKELMKRSSVTIITDKQGSAVPKGEFLNLLPVPQKVQLGEGYFEIPEHISYSSDDSIKQTLSGYLKILAGKRSDFEKGSAVIHVEYISSLPQQGYILDIRPEGIKISYSNKQGLYYSLVSLKVLNVNYKGKIPCVYIEDSPDLAVRGVMLDISRDKVPTLATIKGLVQLLADLKYNHFELYVEGFSFGYPTYKDLWEGKETPVTGEEIKELDSFCKERFIDLVPNQNSLGHMTAWLETDRFKDLAECPKGYRMMGLINMKSTLDPSDPRSIELISGMTKDLLPNFTSQNFNVNLDEPFELGEGKSKDIASKSGVGQVYLDYAKKVHDIVVANNKRMLMWGDVVLRHPELIPQIPKDITLLDWGYEATYPFERHCKILKESGLPYMVCPGTSSWTSITGRTDNMLGNIESATTNGFKYGARGMLITDWGDMGHWQYLPVSYAGYTAGASLSWNTGSIKKMYLGPFLNAYVFRDRNSVMGDFVLEMGRYNRYEEIPMLNMTTTQMSLQFGLRNKVLVSAIFETAIKGIKDLMKDLTPEMIVIFEEKMENRHSFDYDGLTNFLNSQESLLEKARIDSSIIKDEYRNAIRLVRMGTELQEYINSRDTMTIGDQKAMLQGMKDLGNTYLLENKRLWMQRNKPGGYDRSIAVLNTLLAQIDERIILLGKPAAARALDGLIDKVVTAVAVLYLKIS
jgi:hexosaminidase